MHTNTDPNPTLPPTSLADSTADSPADAPKLAAGPAGEQLGTSSPKLQTPAKDARRRHHWNKFVRRGRPSTFNEDVADAMYESILEAGVTDSRAALLAHVSTTTVSRWKQQDPSFADFLETARAEFEIEEVRKIRRAKRRDGQPNAQNSKWLLQHTNPETWGGRSRQRSSASRLTAPALSRAEPEAKGQELGREQQAEMECSNAQTDNRFANPQQSNSSPNIPEIAPPAAGSPAGLVLPEQEPRGTEHAATQKPATPEIPTHQSAPFRVLQQSKSVPILPEIPSGHSCVSFAAGSVTVPDLQSDLRAILARRKQERKGSSRPS